VNTLDFFCDWGSAAEYMELMSEMAEAAPGEDLIIATGKTWHARHFAEQLFARHGVDYRRHIEERQPKTDPPAVDFCASTAKLARILGKVPRQSILEVCDRILEKNFGKATA
jgi:GDPmannose 4,6-dehydratase